MVSGKKQKVPTLKERVEVINFRGMKLQSITELFGCGKLRSL